MPRTKVLTKPVTIVATIETKQLEHLQDQAKREDRSVAYVLRQVINDHIQTGGRVRQRKRARV